jgi:hypothetical protein
LGVQKGGDFQCEIRNGNEEQKEWEGKERHLQVEEHKTKLGVPRYTILGPFFISSS